MSCAAELLLITWNRIKYVEKTLERLLAQPDDYRLYCWDNGSTDGVAELIRGVRDSRVVERHFSPTNENQRPPCRWFLDRATSDVVGKVDDDVLLPDGWTTRLAEMVRAESRFGMLGCCIFMEDEIDSAAVGLNTVEIAGYRVLRAVGIAGQAFLCRKSYLEQYYTASGGHGLPVNRPQMTLDGLVSGYPLPLMFAHNMDHPRSPMNLYSNEATWNTETKALTSKILGFRSPDQAAEWIRRDAERLVNVPFDEQVRQMLNDMHRVGWPGWKRRAWRVVERMGLG